MLRSRRNAERYTWGDGCEGWHLLASPGLSVIQEWMPAGAAEARHLHRNARQLFFVLSGGLEIELDGEVFHLSEEESLEVAPGRAHTVRSPADRPATFLVVSAPPSHGDRVEA